VFAALSYGRTGSKFNPAFHHTLLGEDTTAAADPRHSAD